MNLIYRLRRIEQDARALGPCIHRREPTPGLIDDDEILRDFFRPCAVCGWQPTFVDLTRLATSEEDPQSGPAFPGASPR